MGQIRYQRIFPSGTELLDRLQDEPKTPPYTCGLLVLTHQYPHAQREEIKENLRRTSPPSGTPARQRQAAVGWIQVSSILLPFINLHLTALLAIATCLKIVTPAVSRPSYRRTTSPIPSFSLSSHHTLHPTIALPLPPCHSLHLVVTSCILPLYTLSSRLTVYPFVVLSILLSCPCFIYPCCFLLEAQTLK